MPPHRPRGQGHGTCSLFTIDTLRADHLGCYGYEKATSPAIDELARQGFRFDWAFAQRTVTWPSLASIMTSQYPSAHGVRYNGMPMSPDLTPLAETLSQAGYRCAAFFSPHVKRQLWEGFETRVDGAVVAELTGMIALWQEKFGWKIFKSYPGVIEEYLATIDPKTREELEALGYVF